MQAHILFSHAPSAPGMGSKVMLFSESSKLMGMGMEHREFSYNAF